GRQLRPRAQIQRNLFEFEAFDAKSPADAPRRRGLPELIQNHHRTVTPLTLYDDRHISVYDDRHTMRYAPDHKQRTHEKILSAAWRLFRERGILGAGVDGVMRQAGLTAGGFYAHFRSKDDLLAQTLRRMLVEQRTRLIAGLEDRQGFDWLREVVRRYLSRSHRDDVPTGDALPPLLS